jgi:hypothetical protein
MAAVAAVKKIYRPTTVNNSVHADINNVAQGISLTMTWIANPFCFKDKVIFA